MSNPPSRSRQTGGHINHGQEKCISAGGLRLDETVAKQVLEAVQPVGVTAALDVIGRFKTVLPQI